LLDDVAVAPTSLGLSTKTAQTATVLPGRAVSYTVSLVNSAAIGLTQVVMTDTLPAPLTYLDGSLSATSGSAQEAAGVISWSGPMEVAGVVTITFGASVDAATPLDTPVINNVVISDGTETLTRTATVLVSLAHVYLPVLVRPHLGFSGRVTVGGALAAGVALDLRFFDGAAWSTEATTVTDGDGAYLFSNVPSLGAGQRYYVRYLNTTDSTRLYGWFTPEVTQYTNGDSVAYATFDIANLWLGSPASGATVALPTNFQWTPRPATPSDSYEFNLYDYNDGEPYFYTDPLLGYVGNYTLTSLPAGFEPGPQYAWTIGMYSPDGGYGIAFWANAVTFSNSGSAPALRQRGAHPIIRLHGPGADMSAAQLRLDGTR
jgi:uncharacterized repeat protein (TIGR01451 family)